MITNKQVLDEVARRAGEELYIKDVEDFPFPIAKKRRDDKAFIVVGCVQWEEVREELAAAENGR